MTEWFWDLRRRTRDTIVAGICLVAGLVVSTALVAAMAPPINWPGLILGVVVGWLTGLAICWAAGWCFR